MKIFSIFILIISIYVSRSQDCGQLQESSCRGAFHEGQQCFWHCEAFECIGANPGDPDHVCGEKCNSNDCRNAVLPGGQRCCWDENKCQSIQDVESPQLCAMPDATSAGSDSTSTSGSTTTSGSESSTAWWACTRYSSCSNHGTAIRVADVCICSCDPGFTSPKCDRTFSTVSGTSSTSTNSATSSTSTNSATSTTTNSGTSSNSGTSTSTGSGDGTSASSGSTRPIQSFYKCEMYDNDPAGCDAQAHCMYEVGNPGEGGECDEIEGNDGSNLDCETHTTAETCKGKTHEGQVCRWSCTGNDCEESNANDMEHICDQHCSQETCPQDMCIWDSSEFKCVQHSDFADGAFIPSASGNSGVSNTGSSTIDTSGSSGSSTSNTGSGSDSVTSETGTATDSTTSNTGSGSDSVTSETAADSNTGSENSGSGSTSGSTSNSGSTTSNSGSSFFWGDTGLPSAGNINADCEEYLTAESCNGQTHDGKACYWDPVGSECDEAKPGDPEHYCPTITEEFMCDAASMCGWFSPTQRCLGMDDYEADCEMYVSAQECNGKMHEGKICFWNQMECDEADPTDPEFIAQIANAVGGYVNDYTGGSSSGASGNFAASGNSGASGNSAASGNFASNRDCETYMTFVDCTGQMHDGKKCYWKAEIGECEEGEIGDPEKICAQWGSAGTCPAGCAWLEMKCQVPSTLFKLRKSKITPQNEHQSKNGWKYYAWFGVFMLANIMLGVLCALFVRYVLCNKRPQADESYVNLDNLEENMA